MRIIATTCLCIALSSNTARIANAEADLPGFFTSSTVDTAQLAIAVNHFVELGESKTIDNLRGIRSRQAFNGKIDVQLRLACICRVLWQNSDHPIPPPSMGMYGGGVSIGTGRSAKLKGWPIFPVAREDKSYFIIVYGGRGGTGISHRLPSDYFIICKTSGKFLAEKITVPTKQRAKMDAIKLRQSERWKNEFPDQAGEREAWRSIESQIPKNAK